MPATGSLMSPLALGTALDDKVAWKLIRYLFWTTARLWFRPSRPISIGRLGEVVFSWNRSNHYTPILYQAIPSGVLARLTLLESKLCTRGYSSRGCLLGSFSEKIIRYLKSWNKTKDNKSRREMLLYDSNPAISLPVPRFPLLPPDSRNGAEYPQPCQELVQNTEKSGLYCVGYGSTRWPGSPLSVYSGDVRWRGVALGVE
jgi:hypothetical protein